MTGDTEPPPFVEHALPEVHLTRAPLLRVLAQIRFESMGAFIRPNVVLPFVEALSATFPLYDEGHETQLVVGPQGIAQQQEPSNKIWRLRTADTGTTVTVSNGSLALESTTYDSRSTFLGLLSEVISTFNATIGISSANRVGVRYTNRIDLSEVSLDDLREFLRSDMQGGIAVRSIEGVGLQHSISDILFNVDGGSVQARTGILPENAVFDPTLPATPQRSWFLDIDSYSESRRTLETTTLDPVLRHLAQHAYSLFRWMVTDKFLLHFGGTLESS